MIKNIAYSDNSGIIINDNCYETLKNIDPGSVHLTVTSPPYDNMRTYNEYPKMDIINYGKSLYQATCDGGVCCVVIQDQTKKVKTGTSMMLASDFIRECGWSLFETTIYQRNGVPGKFWNNRFRVDHEYIHIFVKGDTPRYFNKDHMKIPTLHPGKKMSVKKRKRDGSFEEKVYFVCDDTKCCGTIWNYNGYTSNNENNKVKNLHPATFPDRIAQDLILLFSNEGDTVLDPMCGSGTTPVMAKLHNRKYIGIEYSKKYIDECIIPRLSVNTITESLE